MFDCWDACYKLYAAERPAMESFIRFLSAKISMIDQAYKALLERHSARVGYVIWGSTVAAFLFVAPLLSLFAYSLSKDMATTVTVYFACLLGLPFTTFLLWELFKPKYDRYKSEKSHLQSALSRARAGLAQLEEESRKFDPDVFGDFLRIWYRYYTKEEIEEIIRKDKETYIEGGTFTRKK